jgi:hypothetical protein
MELSNEEKETVENIAENNQTGKKSWLKELLDQVARVLQNWRA